MAESSNLPFPRMMIEFRLVGVVTYSPTLCSADPFQFLSMTGRLESTLITDYCQEIFVSPTYTSGTRYDLCRRVPLGTWLQVPGAIDRKLWHNALRVT